MRVLLVEDYPADAMLVEMKVRDELPEARFQMVQTWPHTTQTSTLLNVRLHRRCHCQSGGAGHRHGLHAEALYAKGAGVERASTSGG